MASRKPSRPRPPDPIPASMAGSYIAWSPDGLRILGSGASIAEARLAGGGRPGVLIQKVPAPRTLRPAGAAP